MLALLVGLALMADPAPEAVRGEVHYRVLPAGGVAVIGPDGQTRAVLLPGAPIASVLVQGDRLIIIEARQLATFYSLEKPEAPQPIAGVLPFTTSAAAAPPETAPPPAAPPPAAAPVSTTGHVKKVDGGRVLFELEAGALKRGAHVKIISQRLVEKPDLVTGAPRRVASNEVTAVLEVEELEGARGMAPLGRGDFAEEGDLVQPTDEPLSQRLMVPRRSPFSWRFGFMLRPFLGLDVTNSSGSTSKPVGLLLDAYAAWYPDFLPVVAELQVAPFAVGIGSSDSHYPTTIAFTVAYATDYFEIGLGVGALVGNKGPCDQLGENCEVNNGVTINQVLRLGSLDGLSLTWRSSIFSRPDRFVFGVGRGELNVPLISRLGLFAAGGAGENGWEFGELGVRTYLDGTGARGTMLLSASLGYAAIFDGPQHEQMGGPSVAIGIEWRR